MYRQDDNIRIYLREIGWEDMDCIHLVQDRDHLWTLVNMVMNVQVPYTEGNWLTS